MKGSFGVYCCLPSVCEERVMINLVTPISEEAIASLHVGDTITISGYILCGRDAVLPKVLKMIEEL